MVLSTNSIVTSFLQAVTQGMTCIMLHRGKCALYKERTGTPPSRTAVCSGLVGGILCTIHGQSLA